MEIKTSELVVSGDIHGDFSLLVWNLLYKYKLRDTTVIIAGDCGFGFDETLKDLYVRKRFDSKLKEAGVLILCVRGNHDDPSYYESANLVDYPCIKTIPDYTHLTWGNRKVLVIGGGVSVDKEKRLKFEEKTGQKIWWEGERIVKSPELLDTSEDIIISHMAPFCIGPVCLRGSDMPYDIWAADKSDREYLSTVLKETKPNMWIFGHYHSSTSGDYENCLWRGLDIQEIYEIR